MKYKISLLRLASILAVMHCFLHSQPIQAQESIANEYRLIVVPTYAISKDFFITTYLGYVNNTDSKIISTYVGLPGLFVYKPKDNLQLQAGAFLIINSDNSTANKDNKEIRYVLGEKINLPNASNLHLFNWTRYELRDFNYNDHSLNKTNNRIRSRFAIEFPIGKNPWQPNSWYGISDFELFYTFEKGYFERFRQRFGVGYVIDKQWTLNFVYHIQLDRAAKNLNPEWTTNIFRLDVRWSIPHKKHQPLTDSPDAD
jgi:hypothetical protein